MPRPTVGGGAVTASVQERSPGFERSSPVMYSLH